MSFTAQQRHSRTGWYGPKQVGSPQGSAWSCYKITGQEGACASKNTRSVAAQHLPLFVLPRCSPECRRLDGDRVYVPCTGANVDHLRANEGCNTQKDFTVGFLDAVLPISAQRTHVTTSFILCNQSMYIRQTTACVKTRTTAR